MISETVSPALRYMRSIRNPVKRFYAFDVHEALTKRGPMPDRPANLGTMAAQAVELRLREIIGGAS